MKERQYQEKQAQSLEPQEDGMLIEGRNAVLEAFRAGKTVDRLYVL